MIHYVQLPLSPEEFELLRQKASELKMSRSQLLHDIVIAGIDLAVKDPEPVVIKYVAEYVPAKPIPVAKQPSSVSKPVVKVSRYDDSGHLKPEYVEPDPKPAVVEAEEDEPDFTPTYKRALAKLSVKEVASFMMSHLMMPPAELALSTGWTEAELISMLSDKRIKFDVASGWTQEK